ncbi:AraC family transcriptional regulator [Colwellia psychrerythraea]|uniref:Transcriptional regulator with only HTH domain, AraC family n=1 Tax=Colwellia psychrerythraea TaxID=28229 RepID=A0A099KC85_COLPS|nr:AraC family transcriptional regulator [Colwellia psychrerythraea]KGJ87971.1 transcriptional regulator with only HTH domain, AraC family [Colwellia psychrerythraea]
MSAVLDTNQPLTFYPHQHTLMQYLNPTIEQVTIQKSLITEVTIQLYHTDTQQEITPPLCFNLTENKTKIHNPHSSYPMFYQRKKIGDLYLKQSPLTTTNKINNQLHFQTITKKLALLIQRFQATKLSLHYLGKELSLTGYSEPLLDLDSFIEKAASISCPIIIEGGFGSEKLCVASAIHYSSQLKHQPFIEINCSTPNIDEFQKNVLRSFEQAQGGCIYLHGIDALSLSQQNFLTELLSASTIPGVAGHTVKSVNNIRLLVSTTIPLCKLVENKLFANELYKHFNFLNVKIPPLSKRKEDIPHILEKLIKKYGLFEEQGFDEQATKALCDYHWPENYAELERIVTQLLTLAASNPIKLADIENHTPEILTKENLLTADNNTSPCASANYFDLKDSLINKDYQKFNHLHLGLQKALHYLAENYTESISLTLLAKNVFISPSHLSYLFKHYLKKTFKQILSELRIERAKQIFAATPLIRITDVSLDVGFGDLSHFEKIFKRYTKMTPREYKSRYKISY